MGIIFGLPPRRRTRCRCCRLTSQHHWASTPPISKSRQLRNWCRRSYRKILLELSPEDSRTRFSARTSGNDLHSKHSTAIWDCHVCPGWFGGVSVWARIKPPVRRSRETRPLQPRSGRPLPGAPPNFEVFEGRDLYTFKPPRNTNLSTSMTNSTLESFQSTCGTLRTGTFLSIHII